MVKHRRESSSDPKMVTVPSPRALESSGDPESVRKKLCESLTSALEMVVSKQVVKSVLGVINSTQAAAEVDEILLESHFKTQDEVLSGGSIECEARGWMSDEDDRRLNKESDGGECVTMDMDFKPSFEGKQDVKDDEPQEHSLPLSDAYKGRGRRLQSELSSSKKLKPNIEETVSVAEEAKGGLQLMEQAKKVACSVEFNLFSLNGGVNKKYKEKARSLLFNLKDKSNPELRVRVFTGEITPEILVRMSAEQLASKKLSQWRTAKAEEFASMVVLTDADVDPRRIVKKTHKGEFPVVVEEIDFSASEKLASRTSIPVPGKEDGSDGTRGDALSDQVGRDNKKFKSLQEDGVDSQIDISRDSLESVSRGADEQYFEGHCTNKSRHDATDYRVSGVKDTSEEPPFEKNSSDGTTLLSTPVSLRENSTVERSNGPKTRKPDSKSVRPSSPTDRDEDNGIALWEGGIQISATRYAPVHCFYKTGEKLELNDWPKSVEIKGRVKLLALDKFLQDLQLSRSRTVTIVSICPSDGQGNVKQTAVYLKDMADHFRTGERAGFVEPLPGFELYLLAPDSASLDILQEDLRNINVTVKRKTEVLVGVVVWRKGQFQGLQSRRSDQNASVKKGAPTNLLSDGPAEVNAKPLCSTNTSSLAKEFPASRKTASDPLLSEAGSPSIRCTKSLLTTPEPPPGFKEGHQLSAVPLSLQFPPVIPPRILVSDNSSGFLANTGCQRYQSVEPLDIPPGFSPKPMQPFIPPLALSPNVDGKDLGRFNGSSMRTSFLGGVSGQSRLVLDGHNNFTPLKALPIPFPAINHRMRTNTHEEDDLPEFDFEAEAAVQRANGNFLSQGNQYRLK